MQIGCVYFVSFLQIFFLVLQFPLILDSEWSQNYRSTGSTDGLPRVYNNDFEVDKMETITIEAGDFKTYKIEQRQNIQGRYTNYYHTYWYAPAAKRVIKKESCTNCPAFELLSFEVK